LITDKPSIALIGNSEIEEAERALSGQVVRTPLITVPAPRCPGPLLIKAENFQHTGSFKVRGALNAIRALSKRERDAGVITFSSGNHAQAVAYAARLFGCPCTVVMPTDAQPVKVEATRAHGAAVIQVPPAERRRHAEELAAEHGYALIPPFDHRLVIAGQATVGREILTDAPGVSVILVPVGGGALASGVATAAKLSGRDVRVIGVEPELAGDAAEGFHSGQMRQWSMDVTGRTVADGLRTNLSELTFAHLSRYLDDLVTVSEDDILDTVGVLARNGHLVSEPSGAVAASAYLFHGDRLPAGPTVAVVSGGNVAPELLSTAVLRTA
jgi:threonine dehydratase